MIRYIEISPLTFFHSFGIKIKVAQDYGILPPEPDSDLFRCMDLALEIR